MSYHDRTFRFGFGGGITTAIKYFLIINIVVFVFQHLVPNDALIDWFGMKPNQVLGKFHIWQLFTYMFLHGGPGHLIINMLVLWIFGCAVEGIMGTRAFVKYYLICGLGGGLFHLIFNYGSPIPVIGASGAVYGIVAAFGVLFADRVFTLLLLLVMPVQVKGKYIALFAAAVSLLFAFFGGNDGVAHFAHLGGMAVGFAYLKLDWRLDYFGKLIRQRRESNRAVQNIKKQQAMQQIRERVDEILDKINEVGYGRLNAEEKRILQEASKKFGQEKEAEN